ncbi:MAG: hypothetical protein OEM67_10805 [Thermoleophilia bacterium]|nr:hypothetical protein [Thermoleophilia bacterium]
MEMERLDAAAAVLWPKVLDGDLRAHDRWLRNRESYRRLLGLDERETAGDETMQVIINLPDWAQPLAEVVDGEFTEVAPGA